MIKIDILACVHNASVWKATNELIVVNFACHTNTHYTLWWGAFWRWFKFKSKLYCPSFWMFVQKQILSTPCCSSLPSYCGPLNQGSDVSGFLSYYWYIRKPGPAIKCSTMNQPRSPIIYMQRFGLVSYQYNLNSSVQFYWNNLFNENSYHAEYVHFTVILCTNENNVIPREHSTPLQIWRRIFGGLVSLTLWRLGPWINHLPPVCWSTFWKSSLK